MTFTVRDLVQIALVAALYAIFTALPPFNLISYGPYQFRLSEMLNFLGFYKVKYIIGLTLGCMIANLYSYDLLDVFVGGGQTLIFVSLGVWFFKKYQQQTILGYNKAFFFFSFFFAASMFVIAAELAIVSHAPFFITWFTTAVGELASLLIGGYLINLLGQRINLTQ
ncbi:QueT transporter family protein [Streptococcus dentapri]|uniref:QueT transporter family protein n=1 Tax=Streptococcus dentapri TaxID=573564 RepID=A0ABV8D028_9STRE